MKYKTNFTYSFSDSVNPPRFKGKVDVATPLEFPFPKNIDDLLQDLKQRDPGAYASRKLDQFEDYTGIRADKFQSGFNSDMESAIDANFVAFIKRSVKPNFDAQEWKKVLSEFELTQKKFVAARFSESLAAKVKITYDKLEKIKAKTPEKDECRLLSVEEAFVLWTGRHPVKFNQVDPKFYRDHMAIAISHQEAFAGAVARYKKSNAIKVSTWVTVDEAKILNLCNNAKVYPTVHKSGQQVAVQISLPSTVVTLSEHKNIVGAKREKELAGQCKYLQKIKDDLWVSGTFASLNQSFYVIGQWTPDSGQAELYHYQDNKPAIGMEKKYLRWIYSHARGKYIGPEQI